MVQIWIELMGRGQGSLCLIVPALEGIHRSELTVRLISAKTALMLSAALRWPHRSALGASSDAPRVGGERVDCERLDAVIDQFAQPHSVEQRADCGAREQANRLTVVFETSLELDPLSSAKIRYSL